jgi:ribonuclease T2
MPSISLIQQECRKDGTCSGLSPDAYFAKARQAFDSIQPPGNLREPDAWQTPALAEIIRQFRAASPALVPDSVTVSCTANLLTEIRVCMDQSLKPIPYPDTSQCRALKVRIPPVR